MNVPSQEELVGLIDAFLARHPDIGEARFGRDATGEPGLITGLRGGRSPTIRILRKIVDYMAEKDAELAGADHAASDTTGTTAPSCGKTGDLSASGVAA